jgi:hypothetical protein
MTEQIESAIRDAMAGTAAAVPEREDVWARFTDRERVHTRQRRRRMAIAAALLVVAIAVQTDIAPLPGRAPRIATADTWAAFKDAPVRGSLAGDGEWLAAFRSQIPEMDTSGETRVVYAGDAGSSRVALVLIPHGHGMSSVLWYVGPAAARPDQMDQRSNVDGSAPAATLMDASSTGNGFAVVVGPVGSDIAISTTAVYSPAGVVEHHQITTTYGTGVAVAVVPPSDIPPAVTTRVTGARTVFYAGPVYGSWSSAGGDRQDPSAAQVASAAHGAPGPGIDPQILSRFINSALSDGRLATADVTIRVLWTGNVNGRPAALFTLQPAGGGVLAYAMHGTASDSRGDLRLLVPAAGAFRRPIAWRMLAEGKETETNQVMVVAQAGATATITVAGASPLPVPLDATGAGSATVPPGAAAVVTAYASDGSVIASTPVPPFETDSSGLPGDTPGTRIVP